jgi:hypothetical protein
MATPEKKRKKNKTKQNKKNTWHVCEHMRPHTFLCIGKLRKKHEPTLKEQQ